HLLGRIAPPALDLEMNRGWADIRCETEYRHETPVGTLLTIRSQVQKVGTKSLTYLHTMSGSDTGTVHAVAQVTTVRFDLALRRAVPLDETERARALGLEAEPE